jgi:hypothetical protein
MPALDRPVMTGLPEIVGLTKVAADAVNEPVNVLVEIVELVTVTEVNVPPVTVAVEVTAPLIVAPLMIGVVRVLRVSVCSLRVPTTTPSLVTIPCTCVWLARSRMVWSMSKPRAAICVSDSRNSRPDTPWRTTAPAECATPWVLSEPRVTDSVVPEPATTVTTSSLEVSGSTISV